MNDQESYYQLERPEMRSFLPSRFERVLEVGCAQGRFARALPPGCEIWGCEANPEIAGQARASGRFLKILPGNYDVIEAEIPADYFDLIICNDVIEHMPDHDYFLASASKKLREGGFLMGSIPNVRYIENLYGLLIKGEWHYQDAGILDRTHLRFFTRKSLERTLTEHGFEIERMQGINPVSRRRFRWVIGLLKVATFGRFSDARFLQFGFRARKPVNPSPSPAQS